MNTNTNNSIIIHIHLQTLLSGNITTEQHFSRAFQRYIACHNHQKSFQ